MPLGDRAILLSLNRALDMAKNLYRIAFLNQGQVYEIYARSVSQGGLFGFIEVEEIVFGERSGVVVDPSEERLKSEFEHVTRSYVPLHSVIRIDEVDRRGASRITEVEGNVTQFPMPVYSTDGSKNSE